MNDYFEEVNKANEYELVISNEDPDCKKNKMIKMVITSTNDLMSMNDTNRKFKIIGFLIMLLQVALHISLIINSFKINHINQSLNFELILVRLFVSIYISAVSISSFSCTSSEAIFNIQIGELPETTMFIIATFVVPFMFITNLLLFPLNIYEFSKNLVNNENLDEEMFVTNMEKILFITSILSTILVTKQQNDVISTIFNFSGVLIIMSFDEVIASILNIKGVSKDRMLVQDKLRFVLAEKRITDESDLIRGKVVMFIIITITIFLYLILKLD
jgi:hypothetical protein